MLHPFIDNISEILHAWEGCCIWATSDCVDYMLVRIQVHNLSLFEGRIVCQWSRSVIKRTLPWRSQWPIKVEMMHTKRPWTSAFPAPWPTQLTALHLMYVLSFSFLCTFCSNTHTHTHVAVSGSDWDILISEARSDLQNQHRWFWVQVWAWKPFQKRLRGEKNFFYALYVLSRKYKC